MYEASFPNIPLKGSNGDHSAPFKELKGGVL